MFTYIYISYKNGLKFILFEKSLPYFGKDPKPNEIFFLQKRCCYCRGGKASQTFCRDAEHRSTPLPSYRVLHDQLWSMRGTFTIPGFWSTTSKLAHKSCLGDTLTVVQTDKMLKSEAATKMNQFPWELVYREPDTVQCFLLSWNHSTYIKVKAQYFVYSIQNRKLTHLSKP